VNATQSDSGVQWLYTRLLESYNRKRGNQSCNLVSKELSYVKSVCRPVLMYGRNKVMITCIKTTSYAFESFVGKRIKNVLREGNISQFWSGDGTYNRNLWVQKRQSTESQRRFVLLPRDDRNAVNLLEKTNSSVKGAIGNTYVVIGLWHATGRLLPFS